MDNKFSVLIVDDEAVNVQLISSVLSEEYNVLAALDGHDAISQLKEHIPDLILLDVMMPDINGFEVCKIIKANPLFIDIPVIFLTVLDTEEDILRGLEVGGIDYLTKPVNLDLLKLRIRNHINTKERRERMEGALRNERNLIANIMETSPLGITTVDSTGRITFANAKAISILGLSKDEITQLTYNAPTWHISGIDGSPFPDNRLPFTQVMSTGKAIYDVQHAIQWPDGKRLLLSVNASPLLDADNQVTGIVATVEDITEHRKAEEALVKSEECYRELFNSMVNGFALHEIILDEKGVPCDYRFIAVNAAFERLTNLKGKEILGRSILEIAPQTERFWIDTYGRVALTEESCHFEHYSEVLGKYFEINAYCPQFGQFVCVFADITERKNAELEKTAALEELRETKEYLQNLLDYANVPIIVWDDKFCITIFNHAFEEVTGRKKKEVFGRPLEILFPDETREQSIELIKQTSSGERWDTVEIPIENLDGNVRTLLWNSATIFAPENKQPIATIAQGYDVTDRKQAEAEKAKLESQLYQAQKMESVGRLAGGVAHDFNNKLTVILGCTNLAFTETNPDTLKEYLEYIHKAGEQSADLTRQLLAFARQQTIAPKVLDLNEAVSGMLKMLQRLIGEDINLNWHPAPNLWQVKLDPSQIDQILANLCVNARDSIADVGKITIESGNSVIDEEYCAQNSDFAVGEYVRLTVSDSGCGMDKFTLAQIFEPFFTTKGPSEGTGLGLATVYGIVKQNNGFINVYSEPDLGTTFTIYLPRYTGKAELARTGDAAEPAKRGKETILLVEDEPDILSITSTILRKQGYSVQAANTPREAIWLASEHVNKIDLLMTDVVMPDMNGKDLAKKLQSLYPEIKCLYMSGYTANVIAHHGVLDEGIHFIQKPYSLPDLAAKVREVLDAK